MIVLAIDSTAVIASAAIAKDSEPICVFTVQNGNKHSETLLPMVKNCLDMAGLTPDDIDLFACSAGPGSFTGVRIGAATVKGLAFGTGKPCVGVSSLEALARNLIGFDGILCPVMNARRGQVYNALFRCKNGELTRLVPDRALAISDLNEELKAYVGEPVYLSGDGYDITAAGLFDVSPRFVPVALRAQNAFSVSQAAICAYERGEAVSDANLVPCYLRLSQAERERLAKQNPGGIKM